MEKEIHEMTDGELANLYEEMRVEEQEFWQEKCEKNGGGSCKILTTVCSFDN